MQRLCAASRAASPRFGGSNELGGNFEQAKSFGVFFRRDGIVSLAHHLPELELEPFFSALVDSRRNA